MKFLKILAIVLLFLLILIPVLANSPLDSKFLFESNAVLPSITIDAKNSTNTASGTTINVELTTTCNNSLIIVIFNVFNTASHAFSSITMTGITLTQRSVLHSPGSDANTNLYYYYGTSGDELTKDLVTLTVASSTYLTLTAFDICGSNTGSPFAGSIQTNTGASGAAPSLTFSTSLNPTDMDLVFLGADSTSDACTVDSQFTQIACAGGVPVTSEWGWPYVQGSIVVTGQHTNTNINWAIMGDAVQPATSGNYYPSTGCQTYGCIFPMVNWNQLEYKDMLSLIFANNNVNASPSGNQLQSGEWEGYNAQKDLLMYNNTNNIYWLKDLNKTVNDAIDNAIYKNSSSYYNGLGAPNNALGSTSLIDSTVEYEALVIHHWFYPNNSTISTYLKEAANAMLWVVIGCHAAFPSDTGNTGSYVLCGQFAASPTVNASSGQYEPTTGTGNFATTAGVPDNQFLGDIYAYYSISGNATFLTLFQNQTSRFLTYGTNAGWNVSKLGGSTYTLAPTIHSVGHASDGIEWTMLVERHYGLTGTYYNIVNDATYKMLNTYQNQNFPFIWDSSSGTINYQQGQSDTAGFGNAEMIWAATMFQNLNGSTYFDPFIQGMMESLSAFTRYSIEQGLPISDWFQAPDSPTRVYNATNGLYYVTGSNDFALWNINYDVVAILMTNDVLFPQAYNASTTLQKFSGAFSSTAHNNMTYSIANGSSALLVSLYNANRTTDKSITVTLSNIWGSYSEFSLYSINSNSTSTIHSLSWSATVLGWNSSTYVITPINAKPQITYQNLDNAKTFTESYASGSTGKPFTYYFNVSSPSGLSQSGRTVQYVLNTSGVWGTPTPYTNESGSLAALSAGNYSYSSSTLLLKMNVTDAKVTEIKVNGTSSSLDFSIKLSTTHGATNTTFTVSGTTTGVSVVSNGVANSSFRANSGATIRIAVPSAGGTTRYEFNSSFGPTSGTFAASNTTFIIYSYYQLKNSFQASASSPTTFISGTALAVSGTQQGASSTLCTNTISGTSSPQTNGCANIWSDYGQVAAYNSTMGNEPNTNTRYITYSTAGTVGSNNTASITTAGNTYNENYLEQFQNTFVVAANAQTDFDAAMSWSLTCTQAAASGSCSISSTAATSDSASIWTDYNQVVTPPATSTSPPANSQWKGYGNGAINATTGGNTYTPWNYYKQWQNNFATNIAVGGSGATLSCNEGGVLATQALTTVNQAFYCDNGATASATNPVTISSTEQYTDNASTFTISSGGGNNQFGYSHQFYLTTSISPGSGAGTLSPSPGFYNYGNKIALTATAGSGYTFSGWTGTGNGSYTGSANPTTPFYMDNAISEQAAFNSNGQQGGGVVPPPATTSTTVTSSTILAGGGSLQINPIYVTMSPNSTKVVSVNLNNAENSVPFELTDITESAPLGITISGPASFTVPPFTNSNGLNFTIESTHAGSYTGTVSFTYSSGNFQSSTSFEIVVTVGNSAVASTNFVEFIYQNITAILAAMVVSVSVAVGILAAKWREDNS